MTDVKFMNLSENDNPATTDSLLIGNASDGLKRTPVSAIGDMFAVKGLFHTETVIGNNDPTSTDVNTKLSIPIKAPDVPGYNFAFWLNPSTRGSIVPSYVEFANSNPAAVWLNPSLIDPTSPTTIVAVAVYVNSKVA